jgi:hypothetical protein
MATLDDVTVALKASVLTALTTYAPNTGPGQVGIGFPLGSSISQILGQNQSQVSLFPLEGVSQNRTSRRPRWQKLTTTTPLLSAAVSGINSQTEAIVFSGTPTPGLNVHTFFGAPLQDAYYQTQQGESLASLAAAVASGVIALGGSAVPTPDAVIVTGSPSLRCNIGVSAGAGMVAEVRRMMKLFQVSAWCANAVSRNTIAAAIGNNVGIDTTPFLIASDGSAIWVRLRNEYWIEKSQSSYSLYEYHAIFECEYPTLASTAATTIEAIPATLGDTTTIVDGA